MRKVTSCIIIVCSLLLLIVVIISTISFKPFRNATCLIKAIRAEDVSTVTNLLNSGIDPNQTDIPISFYWTIFEFSAVRPISVACETGNIELVKLLIDHGATAEHIEYTGWSPLRETLFRTDADDLEIIQLLLANGADPFVLESGEPPVFAAARMYPELFGDDGYTSNYNETVGRDITAIVALLIGDQPIDMLSESGYTLLMCAAQRGNYHLTEYLISCGSNLALTNVQGETARDLAVKHKKWAVVELLDRCKTD